MPPRTRAGVRQALPTAAPRTGLIECRWTEGLDGYNAPALRPDRTHPAAQQMARNVLARMLAARARLVA